ncbi:hypothetical protein TNCV_4322221 [Trichonephila clavipes]|uniref:Uncharacterized protein n=1 Tax=Trichonephila clavipes TaxID=2585209 RepID=A0A8X6VED4_TRICX|nr:hypothetical protein TNCV_4322221 [Trichonephila clavipes]
MSSSQHRRMNQASASEAQTQERLLNSCLADTVDQTMHSELLPIAHMESQLLTSPRPASIPHKDAVNFMEFLLPHSSENSRPTPQDFASQTTQLPNCRKLKILTTLIKSHAIEVENNKTLINALIQKGHTEEDPFLIETYQRFENCSMLHQQVVSEFSSHHPCDTPGCTIHSTPHPSSVKENPLEFPPLPKSTSIKRKATKTASLPPPPLRKLSRNSRSNSNPEINFKVNLRNKFNELVNQIPESQTVTRTSSTTHIVNNTPITNTSDTSPNTNKLPPQTMLKITNQFRTHENSNR